MGVWEDGRKLRWLTPEEITSIESGQLDVATLYDQSHNREESCLRISEFPVQFGPPLAFTISRQRLLNKVSELKIEDVQDIVNRNEYGPGSEIIVNNEE